MTLYIIAALFILLVITGVGVVLYMRKAASSAFIVDQQAAQLQEEHDRRAAAEEADRIEREQRKKVFADEAMDVESAADALRLLREASARFNASGTVQGPGKK